MDWYVDSCGEPIGINDWVHIDYKVRKNDRWIDHTFEAKIVDITEPDGDWDDENCRPINIPPYVIVEYMENGEVLDDSFPCDYDYYKDQFVCRDIRLKIFD